MDMMKNWNIGQMAVVVIPCDTIWYHKMREGLYGSMVEGCFAVCAEH